MIRLRKTNLELQYLLPKWYKRYREETHMKLYDVIIWNESLYNLNFKERKKLLYNEKVLSFFYNFSKIKFSGDFKKDKQTKNRLLKIITQPGLLRNMECSLFVGYLEWLINEKEVKQFALQKYSPLDAIVLQKFNSKEEVSTLEIWDVISTGLGYDSHLSIYIGDWKFIWKLGFYFPAIYDSEWLEYLYPTAFDYFAKVEIFRV